MSDSSEDSDFEEVEVKDEHDDSNSNEADYLIAKHAQNEEDQKALKEYQEKMDIPQEGLKIIIQENTDVKKKKGFDWNDYFRKLSNRHRKNLQEDLHKASLLCLLARGMYVNQILIAEEILALGLSTLPSKQSYPPKNVDLTYLESFIKWFKSTFKIKTLEESKAESKKKISKSPSTPTKVASTSGRGRGKKSTATLIQKSSKQVSPKKKEVPAIAEDDIKIDHIPLKELIIVELDNRTVLSPDHLVYMFITILRSLGVQVRLVTSLQPIPLKTLQADLIQDPNKVRKRKSADSDKTSSSNNNKKIKKEKKSDTIETKATNNNTSKPGPSNSKNVRKSTAKKPKIEIMSSSDDEEEEEYKPEIDSDSDSDFITSRSSSSQKRKKKTSPVNKYQSSQRNTTTPKKAVQGKGRKMISDDDEEEEEEIVDDNNKDAQGSKSEVKKKPTSRQYYDVWAEVYLEEEERWVSVDVMSAKIMCDKDFEAKASPPLAYVLAFSNDKRVKDVTRRYASKWMTLTQKLRVDKDWWFQSLRPFRGKKTRQDKEEDELLDQQLLNESIPKSVQELKGHPLYALQRHLLKFEALYPPEPLPLGFIKNEPIFSRECVKTLHSREVWVRQAKVVRIGEKPYKIVKARPKYDKSTLTFIKDRPLELFGEWQVEDYIPPIAKDGKVPRNEYGNVELFQEKMLPQGTVHLNEPALNRIAKKLNIDCAPALVGFEFHAGGSHPTYDGYVVCEEFKDILLDACKQEQEEAMKREEARRVKRVRGNWKRLIRMVIVRRRLERKYDTFDFGSKAKKETKVKRPIATSVVAATPSTSDQPKPVQTKRRRKK